MTMISHNIITVKDKPGIEKDLFVVFMVREYNICVKNPNCLYLRQKAGRLWRKKQFDLITRPGMRE